MPSQEAPDIGYYSGLSKDVSQDQSRSGSNPPQLIQDNLTVVKKNHRSFKKLSKYHLDNSLLQQKKLPHLANHPFSVSVHDYCESKSNERMAGNSYKCEVP